MPRNLKFLFEDEKMSGCTQPPTAPDPTLVHSSNSSVIPLNDPMAGFGSITATDRLTRFLEAFNNPDNYVLFHFEGPYQCEARCRNIENNSAIAPLIVLVLWIPSYVIGNMK